MESQVERHPVTLIVKTRKCLCGLNLPDILDEADQGATQSPSVRKPYHGKTTEEGRRYAAPPCISTSWKFNSCEVPKTWESTENSVENIVAAARNQP